jgi:hypothetical protein
MNYMVKTQTKKKSTMSGDIEINLILPKNAEKSTEQTAGEVLTAIRQLEPEEQNEVVKAVLKELAIDRYNSVRQFREAADRAGKNMDVFMYNTVGLEKIMAESMERKG